MNRKLKYSLPLLCLLPVSGFCCGDECDEPTGPGTGNGTSTYDLSNSWTFSTAWDSDLVCTWHLQLQVDQQGRITGTGDHGYITLFLPNQVDAQNTAIYNQAISGSVDGQDVALTFDACDNGEQTFSGTATSANEMAGSGWFAEVLPERPAAPTDLRVGWDGAGTLTFIWSDNSDVETGFEINWTFPWQCELNPVDYHYRELRPNQTTFRRTSVPPGSCGFVRVKAFRFAGKHGRMSSDWIPWTRFQIP